MERQTLSIMKACEVVGVSRRTIYNWISAGKVEYVRTAGGSRLHPDLCRHAVARARYEQRAPVRLRQRSCGRAARVIVSTSAPDDGSQPVLPEREQIRALFHRLNNQLGIILAQAEMLELKAPDAAYRTRASQIVTSALDAMTVTRDLLRRAD
jgi:excisionase family DNA binding protein